MPRIDPELDSMLKNITYYAQKIGSKVSAQAVHDYETVEALGINTEEIGERLNALNRAGEQAWDIESECISIRMNIELAQSIEMPKTEEVPNAS